MVKRLFALTRRFNRQFKAVANLLLSDKIAKALRAQTVVE
jgi:hypothetical protein